MQNSWSKMTSDPSPSPKSELNPLLNPVLEKNLGRWAQVYFTNPPETREQAVLDLLQELNDEGHNGGKAQAATSVATPPAKAVICTVCDSENRPQQRFCGFCGSALRSREPAFSTREQFSRPMAERIDEPREDAPGERSDEPETLSFLGLSGSSAAEPLSEKQSRSGDDRDLQLLRMKDFGSDYYQSDPGPRRRYLLIGAVAVLAGAAYLGWPMLRAHLPSAVRSSNVSSEPANTPQPPIAAETPAAPPPVTSQPTESDSAQSLPANSTQPAKATHEVNDSSLNVPRQPVPASMASRTRNVTLPPDSQRTGADGAQELLLAQRYLDGRGAPADPATAARWLWKSVGKQNPRAALLLAGLYSRGDGVTKSCAQARILLGVAADRGLPEAAKNLRTLETTGCR